MSPSTVLASFCPATPLVMTGDAWLLLEALECPVTTGAVHNLTAIVTAYLAMTDAPALAAAHAAGTVPQLLAAFSRDKRPAQLMDLMQPVKDAINAAFAPIDSGVASSPDDEKKSSPA